MNDEDKGLVEGVDFPFQVADDEDAECDDEITLAVRNSFGIRYLFAWQRIVIANIMDSACGQLNKESDSLEPELYTGRQIVLLPTGAGKSLCFLTPALLLDGPTLVIYPLLALMADQERRMKEGCLKSVVFRGGQSFQERQEAFLQIKNKSAKIILANPEVLQNEALLNQLAQCNIQHIAIDEAHCVSEWGDSFRPAYLTLGHVIETLACKTVTAFTATASPVILERVSEVLFGGKVHVVQSDSDRPNIHYKVINAYNKKRTAIKLALTEEKPMLIFCGTRKNSEDMARELITLVGKDKVRFYHAGMTKEEKNAVESWFFDKTDAILCATCAYGMGVDKKNIRTVLHEQASPTVESYIQEAGRGARDGKTAEAILLWSYDDQKAAEKLPENSRQKAVARFAQSSTCRRQVLLDALGAEQAVCEGCDVCQRAGPAPFAEDAAFVLNYVRSHRKQFSVDQLSANIIALLNERDKNLAGFHIWEHSDVEEIIRQLLQARYIKKCAFPWKGKITCPFKKNAVYKTKKLSLRQGNSVRPKKLVPLQLVGRVRELRA
ncbi:MAG TPA: ATP-dependent DNA helicase RecQ [Treponema sp.]|nr:ATP-dependent DNA helicase RecQ [Treponema sp.]